MSREKLSQPTGDADHHQAAELRVLSAAEAKLSNRAICEFYEAHWARPIALAREDFTDWQMNAAPEADGSNHSIVAIDGTELLAVMGCTPMPFSIGGNTVQAAALTTWVVAPASRGRGIGKSILASLQERYDVLAGSGITAAALPLYLDSGFTFLAHIPRFFHIADFKTASAFAPISSRAQRITAGRQERATSVEWSSKPVSASDLEPQAKAFADHHSFLRDARHLDWRYDRHPAFSYEAFLVRSRNHPGDGAGLILRQDEVDGIGFIHVVDLFGDPGDLAAAVAFAEDEARRRGAAFVDISATSGALTATLRARGWSSAVDDPLVELPSLFYPVELRRPPTTSLAFWSRNHRNEVFDLSKLHISRGDMDLDRPTMAWYQAHR